MEEANESNLILNRKRAERETEECRDKAQRLEKEMERTYCIKVTYLYRFACPHEWSWDSCLSYYII